MFFGTGNGYGVVVDNSDGHKTYMKMGEGGFGVALKDFREVIIFDEQSAYNTFYIIPTYKAADKREAVHEYQNTISIFSPTFSVVFIPLAFKFLLAVGERVPVTHISIFPFPPCSL